MLTSESGKSYMDEHGIDVHCLVPLPWLECEPRLHADETKALEACRIANDEMARVVARFPDRLIGVALIPTTTEQAMIQETTRAVKELGMAGVALFVGPTAKPPDMTCFEGLYRTCEELGAVVWMHPCRPQSYADYDAYKGEGSKHQIWNTFGWIYDTSVAMVHIALAGVFRRYPGLKVVTHHHGAMVPFFTARFDTQRRNFQEVEGDDLLEDLRLFYCDTATFGESAANIQQAIDFFGKSQVLFGTDTPMDMGTRGMFTRTTIASVEALGAAPEDKESFYAGNVLDMLGERFAGIAGAGGAAAARPKADSTRIAASL
ncbi:unnamed protein product [Ectocarpus sp. CCAP 1310/34]|nr:unnamed protein product [Ectocarpus sp. CCAP 1310/34]